MRRKFPAMINVNSHRIRWKYRRDAEAVAEAAEKGCQTTRTDIIIIVMGRQNVGMRFDLLCIIAVAIAEVQHLLDCSII